MDIKQAAHTDAAEQSDVDTVADSGGSPARRRILVAGLSGTALSLVPLLTRRAGASGRNVAATSSSSSATFTANSSDSLNNTPNGASTAVTEKSTSNAGATPGSNGGGANGTGDSTNASSEITIGASSGSTAATDEVTTTTAPPKRPTADDIALLSFEQSMELTIRDLYDVALNLGSFTGAQLETVNAIRDAHEAYGNSISGLLGRNAPNAALPKLFTALKADFAGNAQDVATAARTLENNAAATHIETLDALVGIDGAALIASIIIVEARHATVLASFAGVSALDDLLASDGKALSPSDYTTK